MDYMCEFTLVCYTDGLTDAFNSNNDHLSIDELKDIILKNNKSKPEFLNSALLFYAEEFKGENEFPDDIALLTLKVTDLDY
jgi:serine phosphatase RsbU (regulator of sigma subunit)